MNPRIVEADSIKAKPFKFSDSFLVGFNTMITAYDKKIEDLNRVKSLIDGDAHHGVCNCCYKMRYITPSDLSTFISNLAKAMENRLFKPHTSDADLFAVESVKRFLKLNGCVPFDAPTIMGNPGADIPKGATLADLTFAAESECFGLYVYSKYELEKRIDNMREDIGRIQNMHFSAAVKSFVQKLPGIMNDKATEVMRDALLSKACEVYIEDFIMFAVRLNLTTVLQMLMYAVPREAYKDEPSSDQSNESANNADNWDEDNDFFKMEAVDSTSVSPVFFVFTQGNALISKAIKKATDSDYSHISISFDPSLDTMYSFGITGFRKESIHDKKRKDLTIDVYGTFMSKDCIKSMKDICSNMSSNKTKFDYSALIKKLFNSDNKSNKNYKQICTTFVNKLLSEGNVSLSEKNIPSPEEMRNSAQSKPDQIFSLFTGNSKEYNRKQASDKLKKMGNDPKAKKFDEVVTECCTGFLKTNDYIITNKIPFNCNMRDVVLQDMHPQFKDTISALKFIMNDERSPVHQLIIQYYTEPIDDYDPELIIKMFFGCCHRDCFDPNSRDHMANDKACMNTDVNWLDKITYGNMFLDGNYRRDGLGNQHTHPIMNTFETIYKMFGGCDNVCDNPGLSNNLIRISRIMKEIVNKYCEGCIPDWEMCRDILAVFGEIFTRHMLRLYYNNNHYLLTKDQMCDTMIPGYMYAESFVMEANGFTSMNDNVNKAKTATQTAGNIAVSLFNWFRDKLAEFLPKYFENSLQKQCQWFNSKGDELFQTIQQANAKGDYNFPKVDKYYHFNVTFDPAKVDPEKVINDFISKNTGDNHNEDLDIGIGQLKKDLISVFDNPDDPELPNKILNGEGDMKTKVKNAVLFSQVEDTGKLEQNYQIKKEDWENDIYKTMKFMAAADQDGKSRGGKWAKDIKTMSDKYQKVLKSLDDEVQKAKAANPTPAPNDTNAVPAAGDGVEKPEDTAKTNDIKVKEAVVNAIKDLAAAFYTVSCNSIVENLFKETYKYFKGVVDDYNAMGKPNNNNNNTNNNQ